MPSCQHTPFFQVLSRIHIAFTRKTKKNFFHCQTFFLSSLGSFWRSSVFFRSISICLELLSRGFSSFYSTKNNWLCCFVTFSFLFLPYCIIFMKFSFNLRPVLLARARVCVYSSTVRASSHCKTSVIYLRGMDQRWYVVSIIAGASAKFLHLHF